MSGEMPTWRSGHAIMIGGVLVLVIGLVSIFVHTASAQAELAREFLATNPTALLLEQVPLDERSTRIAQIVHPQDQGKGWGTAMAILGLALTVWGIRRTSRPSRHGGVRIGLLASPVLAVVTLGLLAGLLSQWRFEDLLAATFEAFGGTPRYHTWSCFHPLTRCSRVQAFARVWPVAVALMCLVSASTFLLAAPRAWRAGVRGKVLPRGWALGSIVLFAIGATSLILTTSRGEDIERTAGRCVHENPWEQRNATSPDLDGMVVKRYAHLPPFGHPLDEHVVAVLQADADGRFTALDEGQGPVERVFPTDVARHISHRLSSEGPFVLALYVDQRAPMLALRKHLLADSEAGITDLIVYGQAFVHDGTKTYGLWTRRILCTTGWVRFDDDAELALTDFETWGDLQRAALELGDGPLRLRP